MDNYGLIGLFLAIAVDGYCYHKFGFPSLAILIAKASISKYFKWMAWNIWGNDSKFYGEVLFRLGEK